MCTLLPVYLIFGLVCCATTEGAIAGKMLKTKGCNGPLGMEDQSIKDEQISASSYYKSFTLAPSEGRLNNDLYWATKKIEVDSWIQVDLLRDTVVTGIVTQGSALPEFNEFVETFQIQYGDSPDALAYIMEDGQAKTFPGNTDIETAVETIFPEPINARYLRVKPVSLHDWPSFRFEVLGCKDGEIGDCNQSLGMEDGSIRDDQITASSVYILPDLHPTEGRLNNVYYWAAEKDNAVDSWIQVDLLQQTTVTGIITQGSSRPEFNEWVQSLQIQYGDSEDSLTYMTDGEEQALTFNANSDRNTPETIIFPKPIKTRYLRIVPTSWFDWSSLRFEVLGCLKD